MTTFIGAYYQAPVVLRGAQQTSIRPGRLTATANTGIVDVTAPSVEGLSPASGTIIERDQEFSFTFQDLNSLGLIVVSFRYASGLEELAYDGIGFTPLFSRSSRAAGTPTVPGFQAAAFIIRRTGFWPSGIESLRVNGNDAFGNAL